MKHWQSSRNILMTIFLLLFSLLYIEVFAADRIVRIKNGNKIDNTAVSAIKTDENKISKTEGNGSVVIEKVSTYFPLNVGNAWFYEGPFDKSGNPMGTERVEVTSYSDKYNAYIVESIFKTGDFAPITIQKIIEQRGNSVLQLAGAGGILRAPFKMFEIPQIILQGPLKIGKTWEQEDNAGKKRCKVVGFIKYKGKAGEFENVCKVEERVFLYDKKTRKLNEVDWAGAFQYYAPNIGLIKTELIKNGSIITELIRYSVK